jgi:hypothetical protein
MFIKAILIFASGGAQGKPQSVFAAHTTASFVEAKGAGSIEHRVSGAGTETRRLLGIVRRMMGFTDLAIGAAGRPGGRASLPQVRAPLFFCPQLGLGAKAGMSGFISG